MSEESVVVESTSSDSSAPVASSPASATAAPEQTQAEKLVSQSVVDKAVKHAYERGRNSALENKQIEQAQQAQAPQQAYAQQENVSNAASALGLGGMPQVSPEQVQQMIQQQMHTNQIVGQFKQKLDAGYVNYPDFEEVVAPLNLPKMPVMVELTNLVDNTADVMYELGKNPTKVGHIMTLVNINPQLAISEIKKLSASIAQNRAAVANQQSIPDPLSQISSSPTSSDSGNLTIRDYKKADWLRG